MCRPVNQVIERLFLAESYPLPSCLQYLRQAWGSHNCYHTEDVGVECVQVTTTTTTTTSTTTTTEQKQYADEKQVRVPSQGLVFLTLEVGVETVWSGDPQRESEPSNQHPLRMHRTHDTTDQLRDDIRWLVVRAKVGGRGFSFRSSRNCAPSSCASRWRVLVHSPNTSEALGFFPGVENCGPVTHNRRLPLERSIRDHTSRPCLRSRPLSRPRPCPPVDSPWTSSGIAPRLSQREDVPLPNRE